jgi:hypothetical protein
MHGDEQQKKGKKYFDFQRMIEESRKREVDK